MRCPRLDAINLARGIRRFRISPLASTTTRIFCQVSGAPRPQKIQDADGDYNKRLQKVRKIVFYAPFAAGA